MEMVKFTLTFPEDEPIITTSMSLQHLDMLIRQPILTSLDSGHLNREEAIDTTTIMLGGDPAVPTERKSAEDYLFNRYDELSDHFNNGFY